MTKPNSLYLVFLELNVKTRKDFPLGDIMQWGHGIWATDI
jgi:hypothetical protein